VSYEIFKYKTKAEENS